MCLAPLYDVVPALAITPNVLFMGLRIDGRIRIDRIERENIVAEARSWGLPARVVDEVLGKAAEDVRLGIAIASELYPEAGARRTCRARFGAVEGDGILDSYRQAAWLKGRIRLSSGAGLRLVTSRS